MYKLLVLDVDGTLINQNKVITPKVKEAVLAAKEKGLEIIICTGRPYTTMKNYLEDLLLEEGLCITNTGAYVQKVSDGTIVFDNGLTKDDFMKFYEHLKDDPVDLTVYTSTDLYSPNQPPNPWAQHDADSLLQPLQFLDIEKPWDFPVGRINIMGEKSEVDRAVEKLPKELLSQYNSVRNETFSFEILSPHAGKSNALCQAAGSLNILPEEIIAIGDGDNDKKMLAYAGLSIAMGNAPDHVKKVATYVTTTNEEDGVAHALSTWVL